jgi:hypothetical protein
MSFAEGRPSGSKDIPPFVIFSRSFPFQINTSDTGAGESDHYSVILACLASYWRLTRWRRKPGPGVARKVNAKQLMQPYNSNKTIRQPIIWF